MSKPRASVFRLAALFQHDRMLGYNGCSQYSCDNLDEAAYAVNEQRDSTDEHHYYVKYFMPRNKEGCDDLFAWWPSLPDGQWDHESRILALLLSAEMIRNP